MLNNYLKIALRNILRNKTYSLINILGLSVGITCSLFILFWVQDELNYDRFHENADKIYRIVQHDNNGKNSRSPAQLAPAAADAIPEINAYARIVKLPKLSFRHENNAFYEDDGIIVDPQFFKMFDFSLLNGNPKTFLSDPGNIIITESLAKKYFGDDNPINKTILIDGQNEVKITGVLKDIPTQSHIQFDFVMPFSLWEILNPSDVQSWGAFNYTTYLQLKDNVDINAVTINLNNIAAGRIPSDLLPFWKSFELQPLVKCHTSADISNDQYLGSFTVTEDKDTIYMFIMISVFILILACINFMNLSTARSGIRIKEIGMKKVIGSSRAQLALQFLIEFFLISIIAFLFAIVCVELFLPYFNQISGKEIVINHANNLIPYLSVILLVTFVGGFYPAVYLSSLNPVRILKGQFIGSVKTKRIRSLLVIFQFAISIILLIGTFVVYKQLQFIQNKKLGFEKENIVYMPITPNTGSKYMTIKSELLKNPNILKVTAKDCLPTDSRRTLVEFYWDEKQPGQEVLMELAGVDYQYFEMMNIKFAEGRSFSKEFSTDANAFILNEEAVKQTGIKSPIGKKFTTWNKSGIIVGVIKNTNFKSLHQKVNPQVYNIMNDTGTEAAYTGVILIKINSKTHIEALSYLKSTWERINPDSPFEYHFLDQTYEKLYLAEQRTQELFNYFSSIAIFIACLGLYGLAAFTAEKRRKEIGIRKTLGADIKTITAMLTNDFAVLVLISNIIAFPAAYYFMNKWLQDFAYRIDISLWLFIAAGFIALIIALVTVSFQAFKAATANPVESLKYE
ncbi:MAG: ABC transporter permease [Ignavibacteriaceae bacterium]